MHDYPLLSMIYLRTSRTTTCVPRYFTSTTPWLSTEPNHGIGMEHDLWDRSSGQSIKFWHSKGILHCAGKMTRTCSRTCTERVHNHQSIKPNDPAHATHADKYCTTSSARNELVRSNAWRSARSRFNQEILCSQGLQAERHGACSFASTYKFRHVQRPIIIFIECNQKTNFLSVTLRTPGSFYKIMRGLVRPTFLPSTLLLCFVFRSCHPSTNDNCRTHLITVMSDFPLASREPQP